MRKALVVALLLTLVALAGCSGKDADPDAGDGAADDGRTSQGRESDPGSGEGAKDPPHKDVLILDGDLSLVGPSSATFDLEVPDDVTIVDFDIVSPGPVTQFLSLRVELDGCGVHDTGTGSYGSFGGATSYGARLCSDASGGSHRLVVTNSGFLQGRISVTGQVPTADNATADPAPAA